MNTRCFLLPAILVALFAVSWSPADDLPQAPLPRVKKTTAELLIGTWKQVSSNSGQPLPKTYETTLEMTKDGKVCFRVVKSDRPIPPPRVGEYRLDGNIIRFATERTTETPPQNWSVTIKELDENKLLISASEKDKGTAFVRIKDK
jgi:uncharacterized protein (TIGR03066 family)